MVAFPNFGIDRGLATFEIIKNCQLTAGVFKAGVQFAYNFLQAGLNYLPTNLIQAIWRFDTHGPRMRANSNAALDNDYVHSAAPANDTNCVANTCTPADLAIYDMNTWWQALNANLPSASAEVTRDVGSDTFVITVRWDEDRSGSQGTSCPVESDVDLDCYQHNVTL